MIFSTRLNVHDNAICVGHWASGLLWLSQRRQVQGPTSPPRACVSRVQGPQAPFPNPYYSMAASYVEPEAPRAALPALQGMAAVPSSGWASLRAASGAAGGLQGAGDAGSGGGGGSAGGMIPSGPRSSENGANGAGLSEEERSMIRLALKCACCFIHTHTHLHKYTRTH